MNDGGDLRFKVSPVFRYHRPRADATARGRFHSSATAFHLRTSPLLSLSNMQTTDTGLLFQSSQQLADASSRERKIVAAEKVGNPIKVTSKVLDLAVQGQDAWTAESGWQARRLDLNVRVVVHGAELTVQSGRTKMLYKGHKGPVTSVRLHAVGGADPWLALITSSWDKTVRIWNAEVGV